MPRKPGQPLANSPDKQAGAGWGFSAPPLAQKGEGMQLKYIIQSGGDLDELVGRPVYAWSGPNINDRARLIEAFMQEAEPVGQSYARSDGHSYIAILAEGEE